MSNAHDKASAITRDAPFHKTSPRDRTRGAHLGWADALILLLIYASASTLYYELGVRFDATPFPMFMQFIDRDLLSNHFLQSIWNYHAFPPMLNIVVGLGLKLFGARAIAFYSALFHILGFLLALCTLTLTARLTGSRWLAHVASAVLVISPAFALYENWLMYELPATALLTASAVALQRFVDTQQRGWGLVFFALLAILALTRSVFHLAWLILAAVVLAGLMRDRWRQVVFVAMFPLLITTFWYAKNYVMFGTFSSTSLAGLGLSNITTLTVPAEELLPFVKDGTLSPFALVSRYRDLELIFSSQTLPPTGIPVLDRKYKVSPSDSVLRSTAGHYNFNNLQIVAANHYYLRDSLKTISLFPYYYVTGLRISNLLFFSPSQMNLYFAPANRDAVEPMERIFDPILYGVPARTGVIAQPHWSYDEEHTLEVNPSAPLMALWFIVVLYGYVRARKLIRAGGQHDRASGVAIGFIVGNALYVYCLGTMAELGENYRYKFLVEPLILVLTVVTLTDLVRKLRAMRGACVRRNR